MRRPNSTRLWEIIGAVIEVAIIVGCVAYVVTGELWVLIVWESVAAVYLVAGLIRVWPGRKRRVAPTAEVRAYADWLWVLPVLAAVTGANAAITALMLRGDGLEA